MKLLLLSLLAGSLWAQNVTGVLVGTVKDSSGAVVAGAKVRLVNDGTGISSETRTNAAGDYVFPNLAAAVYSVQAESPGFRKATHQHIELLLGATVRIDARLEPGSLDQSIVVRADAPVVNSEGSSVATSVDSHAVGNLPIDGRTLDALVLLTPGNASDSASNSRIAGSMYWGGNQFTVDGVNVNSHGNGGATYSFQTKLATLPSLETVQEVKVESSMARAEFEGATAVSTVTRSGGNALHGMLKEFNRNRPLTAKEFFATGLTKPQFNRNEFGVNASGPIRRNRAFFFLNYEGLRQRSGREPNVVVPLEANRNGTFTSAVRDPINGNTPFPGNQIPTARLDPRSLKILSFVPLPNTNDAARNFATNVVNRLNTDRATAKIDLRLTDRDTFAVSWNLSNGGPYFVTQGKPPNYGNYKDAGFNTDTESITWTRIVNATSVNELRFGRYAVFSVRQGQNQEFDPHQLFPGLFPAPIGGIPNVAITGITAIGDLGGSVVENPATTLTFTDNYTWVHGRHTVKAGFDGIRNTNPAHPAVSGAALGSFSFTNRYTGNAMGDFMLGYLTSSVREMPTADVELYQSRLSGYVQDDWNALPRLTLNVGLRYMIQKRMQEDNDTWTNFDFATGTLLVQTKDGKLPPAAISRLVSTYPWKSSESYGWGGDLTTADHNNFGPRAGFAWRVTRDSRTVVRGGYGIFYSQIPAYIGHLQMSRTNPPFALRETFDGPAAAAGPGLTFANPFPAGAGNISANPTIQASIRSLRNALSQQWNLTVERQLPGKTGLRLTYLGSKSTRVPWYNFNRNMPYVQAAGAIQPRRPYQPWGDILTLDTNANSFTNQMQIQVQRRHAAGLYLMAHFTWTKNLDNVANSGSPQNPYNAANERGNSDGVRQKVLSFSSTYQLPFGRDGKLLRTSSRVLNAMVAGWNVATITALRSGTPFSVAVTSSGVLGWSATRADAIGDPHVADPNIEGWFNTKAFAAPAQFAYGNAARNVLFGPGQIKVDASLFKQFKLTERGLRLEFRADAFNLPNHPIFGNPGANVSVPSSFGKIRSTVAETNRAIQFAAKLTF